MILKPLHFLEKNTFIPRICSPRYLEPQITFPFLNTHLCLPLSNLIFLFDPWFHFDSYVTWYSRMSLHYLLSASFMIKPVTLLVPSHRPTHYLHVILVSLIQTILLKYFSHEDTWK